MTRNVGLLLWIARVGNLPRTAWAQEGSSTTQLAGQ